MPPSAPHAPRPGKLRFAVFEADLATGELKRRGSAVHLPDKPFQVLAALLERPTEVVTRKELQQRLWPGETFVDFDNNLNAAVRKLREALGDSADRPRFVETLPKRGYRFIAPVEPLESPTPDRAAEASSTWRAAGIALLLSLAVVAFVATRTRPRSVTASTDDRVMLVVLPFVDLDNRPDRRFFGDGLTEEMITQLGRLQPERLGVIARTSSMQYRDTDKSIDRIGNELGVEYVLEGSVRSAGEQIRVTAQLIQVSDQTHLWAETYDVTLDDLLGVQGDVAVRVAQALALELLPEQPLAQARAGTRITEAYQAYLRGRYEWNTFTSDGYARATVAFNQALEIDPNYAAAFAGLADTYNLEAFTAESTPSDAFPKARQAALQALERDPNCAEAHNALAFVMLYHDYDLQGADREFQRAIELAPNYAMAYHWWAGALAALERHDEAIDAMKHAVELDPVSLSVLSDLGWYYLFADRWDDALAECRHILATQRYGWAEACEFHGLVHSGRIEEALARTAYSEPEVAQEFEGQDASSILVELERRRLAEVRSDDSLRVRYPLEIATAAAAAGETDEAFEWIERAYSLREPWLVFLKVDPRFDPLAGDPRYAEWTARLGLPD